MKAFIYNNNIFCTVDESLIPKGTIAIDVPEWVTPLDLIFDGTELRLKTEAEREIDRKLQEAQEAKQKLAETDSQMARVVEDIVSILIAKKVIDESDLPQEVREKMSYRKNLREKL